MIKRLFITVALLFLTISAGLSGDSIVAGASEIPAGDSSSVSLKEEPEEIAETKGDQKPEETAGQVIKLSKSKKTINKGKRFTLKLKGAGSKEKVTWSVSKSGIVKLKNQKKHECTVIAKKPGTVTVRAKYKGKTYKCTVTVRNNIDTITFDHKKYKLVFSDAFKTFNDKKWAYCPEQERQDAGGFWRNSCTNVRNGKLVISCDVDENGNPVSGAIRSTGRYEQKFGLYNIRFKMEKADGLWYALWLLTDKMNESTVGNGATDGAELDMIELVPHTGELCMSVHWDGYGKDLKSYCETRYVDDDFYERYHDLWYLWDEHGYRLYMDGTDEEALLFDFDGKEHGDGTCAVPCDLLISAEYGTWGGRIRKKQLPAHFYVDYVRVYQHSK